MKGGLDVVKVVGYVCVQVVEVILIVVGNEGGLVGLGVGLVMGVLMGQVMVDVLGIGVVGVQGYVVVVFVVVVGLIFVEWLGQLKQLLD